MLGFIAIVLIIVVLVLLINGYQNKFQSFHGKLFNFVVVITLLFLVLSAGYVYMKADIDINEVGDIVKLVKLYFSWLSSFFDNTRTVTGYVINQDWGGNLSSG